MEQSNIQQLIEDYLQNKLSTEQQEILLQYISKNENQVLEVLTSMQADQALVVDAVPEKMLGTLQKVLAVDKVKVTPIINISKVKHQKSWWRVAASFIFLLGLSAGVYKFFIAKPATESVTIVKQDINAPETNRAMITLADGSKVFLDSINNGTVAQQGDIALVKLGNGQIAYQTADGKLIKDLQYNTLSNPRGSKVIDMKLSDGTRVWLNAGSSITYPIAFVGNERNVTLKGEGYFEVAKNAAKPFSVKTNQAKISVLGTHFNISAYGDDNNSKVTLLEGAVKVSDGNNDAMLAPMQQAVVNNNGAININKNVNIDEVMAWKQDQFYFDETSLKDLMKQIERWYDINVVFDNGVPNKKFSGKMYRNMSVSEILKILEGLDVNFKIEGKTLTVTK